MTRDAAGARRRFWTSVSIEEVEGGLTVTLDGRPVRTPARALLVLPGRPLAKAVAAEWAAQQGDIRPATMPLTRAANAAIDKVAQAHGAVAAMLAEYGNTDLLCYRAGAPAELARRQAETWQPWLDWAADRFGARLTPVTGVVFAAQPADSLARLAAAVSAHDTFELTALHDLVTLSGSLVLGLAVSHGALSPQAAWEASRLDENWQAEQWGEDSEAAAAAAEKHEAFLAAARLRALLGTPDR